MARQMEMVRQVKTAEGLIVLQWNKNSSLIRWFAQSFIHTIELKNLIKFRGYLREYCRDIQYAIRTIGMKPLVASDAQLFGTRLNIITYLDDLNSSVRFISNNGNGVDLHGYLTLKTVKRTLNGLARSIITLSEEHYFQRWEQSVAVISSSWCGMDV